MCVGEDGAELTHSSSTVMSVYLPLFSQLLCTEEKGVIYVPSDNNKCLGCSGANAPLYSVCEAQSHLWKSFLKKIKAPVLMQTLLPVKLW